MRLSRGSVAFLTAAVLLAFAIWPDAQPVRGPEHVAAQEKSKANSRPAGALGNGHADNTPEASSKDSQPPQPPVVLELAPIDHPLSSEALHRSKNEARIAAALTAQVGFDIKPQSFKDALDLIASRYQISIVIDERSFDDANIDVTDEVTLKASALTLHDTLYWLFSQMPSAIEFEIKNGALWISTSDRLNDDLSIVVYDCRDLIPVHPASQRPNQKMSMSIRTRAAQLVAMLRATTTRTEDWEDCCSGETIVYLDGLIVARQNPLVHEKIRRLLADTRWMRTHGAFATSADAHSNATKAAPGKKTSALDGHTTTASVFVEREPVDHPLRSDIAERPQNEARIIEALKAPVDFQIQPQSFQDAVELIATRYHIPIVIDRRALSDANVNLTTTVRVNIPGITLHELLHWLFVQANCPLESEVRNGALLITTLDRLNEDLSIVVYDCRDLLAVAGSDRGAAADEREVGAGFSLLSRHKAQAADAAPQTEAANTSSAAQPQPAITAHASIRGSEGAWGLPFIQTIVATGRDVSWGDDASISEFDGLVVIRQSPGEHERIKRLLASIRLMKKNGAFAGLADKFVDPKEADAAHSK